MKAAKTGLTAKERLQADYVNYLISLLFYVLLQNLQFGSNTKVDVIFDFRLRSVIEGLF